MIDCLIGKAEWRLTMTGFRVLCVGGGVAANGRFRARLEASATRHGYELFVPPLSLCTDNAVMGAIAVERLRAGKVEDLSLDISPGPERARRRPSRQSIKTRPEAVLRAALIVLRPNCRKPLAPSAVLLPAWRPTVAAANPASIQPRESAAARTRSCSAGNLDNTSCAAARPTCGS